MNHDPIFKDSRGRPIQPPSPERTVTLKAVKVLIFLLVSAPLLMAAATQINLASQVKGLLAGANGGLNANASSFTGVLRESSGTASAAELSGDATTSGSNAVTVARVNGTTVPTNSAADQVLTTTASATGAWKSLADTSAGGLAETYNTSTHAFGTIAVISGSFADAETPSGTINGSNTSFTLAHTPSPAAGLQLYKNGQQLIAGGADYSLSSATITMTTAPTTGDVLIAFYRY